jgi:CRP-like cAMP-binding protein
VETRRRLPAGCFLGRLATDDRDALLALGVTRRYPPRATIIHHGDEGESVYVLLAGRVKVRVATRDGHESILCVLEPGELMGEFEAIDADDGTRTADNVALETVECRVLRSADFRAYLESRPRAALLLLGVYIRRLRQADRRRTDTVAFDTTHRVARLLLEHVNGRHTRGRDVEIDLPLSQVELAGMAAASRESVVRALTELRTRGLIATARRRITIRDIDELRRYAS